MTLLSPLALLFGMTALVPLVLHLYQRRRRTVIEFSTDRFFTASVIRSQRRLKLRRLLLLILRMAICLLLALALARPIMRLFTSGRPGQRDVVILLDDSMSMQATDGDGAMRPVSSFDRARGTAVRVLSRLAPGDRAGIATFTGRTFGRGIPDSPVESTASDSGVELTEDIGALTHVLQQMQPSAAAGDAHRALAQAAQFFDSAGPRDRCVLALSDFQESDWRPREWPQPQHPIPAALVQISQPTKDNVAVDDVVFSQGIMVVGQPNLLRARIVNHRPRTTAVEFVVEVDGREQVRRPIELPGSSPHVERAVLTFRETGRHRVQVSVAVQDALSADNTRFAAVEVHPQVSVLLVDGQADANTRRSAAFYLQAAMRATSGDGDAAQPNSVFVDLVRASDIAPVGLENYHVVMLSAVRSLPPREVNRLEQFVAAGGGLAVFLGPNADRDFYNVTMRGLGHPTGDRSRSATGASDAAEPDGLLPVELRDRVDTRGGARPLRLLRADLDHPMLRRFEGPLRGALAGINVYQAYAVIPHDAWTVAALDEDLPLAVERSYGRGRVMLFTTVPHPDWTNLPLRRAFLPLVNLLVGHLAGGRTGSEQHTVGQQIVLRRGGWDADTPLHIRRPDGLRVRAEVDVVNAEARALLRPAETALPGFYEVEPGGELLAVNVARRESVPRHLDLDEAERLAGRWRLDSLDASDQSTDAVAGLLAGGVGGRGIWDTLLWTVLILALLEPLIANQLRGSAAEDAVVAKRKAA
jgi:hypothetical protein